jgi:CheY-like chemotaxis protein
MSILNGKRILVVEDEPIVAMMIEQMIEDMGAQTVGPAASLEQALDLAATADVHVAILDLNLNGQRTSEVAKTLKQRGVPFIFATGYGSAGGQDLGQKAVLQKPFQMHQFVTALSDALHVKAETLSAGDATGS